MNATIERWSLAGGLLFGLVQSTLLAWHRRLWLTLSTLAWAVISALTLASLNLVMVLLSENL